MLTHKAHASIAAQCYKGRVYLTGDAFLPIMLEKPSKARCRRRRQGKTQRARNSPVCCSTQRHSPNDDAQVLAPLAGLTSWRAAGPRRSEPPEQRTATRSEQPWRRTAAAAAAEAHSRDESLAAPAAATAAANSADRQLCGKRRRAGRGGRWPWGGPLVRRATRAAGGAAARVAGEEPGRQLIALVAADDVARGALQGACGRGGWVSEQWVGVFVCRRAGPSHAVQ
jgi:hypothetical protein